ncbi:MAG: 1-acyl-sn-glycerol-3-phosphate acyltransferase [Gammaproteobacteria bacterium]|nr:1-acyl-sn-glycerol-3-phosphate acyltransferase [Gammaproteobacteria bacterium]MBU2058120.1 1-acyl-sn-glycerol-3-phosphate acyltransferase [Gammaproteobacteria bacterium]MBU2176027.1 1-acyl-sn-glycerol-3-phosphate acyltransferase [Gammaproteobacteria bacterium]MBU2247214.1 1-acyl-sn-glycerol-3-phosphate acyltransferase [Gammaproteobacteria bacterium]MBU2343366.1 1-acyl-sn-glycerol-3-phosphate acyltransferase [Gammaproteobacteria bacterium]
MSTLPAIPPSLPRRHSNLGQKLGLWLLKLLGGWSIQGELPAHKKMVIAVAPHTSNQDFFVGIAAALALDLKIRFLGKHSIFVWPFKGLLLSLGGIAVDRSHPHGVVGQVVAEFEQSDSLLLGLSPEGSRKKVEHWRSGFWFIARQARVPVCLVGLDYRHKQLVFGPSFTTGENFADDLQQMRMFFQQMTAKYPENA